jgi:hypothetical protein
MAASDPEWDTQKKATDGEMNWDALGAVAEVAGAVGVIVSLIYLAIQIRSNTRFTKVSTVSDSMNSFVQYFREVSSNRPLAELTLKGMADPSTLDPVESVMFTHHVSAVFMMWYKTFLQFESGLVGADFWRTCERDIIGFCRSPGVQIVWEQIHPTFTPEFVERVNTIRLQGRESSAEFYPDGFKSD